MTGQDLVAIEAPGTASPHPDAFCRLDETGLEAVGQRPDPDQAAIGCPAAEPGSPMSGQHCREAIL